MFSFKIRFGIACLKALKYLANHISPHATVTVPDYAARFSPNSKISCLLMARPSSEGTHFILDFSILETADRQYWHFATLFFSCYTCSLSLKGSRGTRFSSPISLASRRNCRISASQIIADGHSKVTILLYGTSSQPKKQHCHYSHYHIFFLL